MLMMSGCGKKKKKNNKQSINLHKDVVLGLRKRSRLGPSGRAQSSDITA